MYVTLVAYKTNSNKTAIEDVLCFVYWFMRLLWTRTRAYWLLNRKANLLCQQHFCNKAWFLFKDLHMCSTRQQSTRASNAHHSNTFKFRLNHRYGCHGNRNLILMVIWLLWIVISYYFVHPQSLSSSFTSPHTQCLLQNTAKTWLIVWTVFKNSHNPIDAYSLINNSSKKHTDIVAQVAVVTFYFSTEHWEELTSATMHVHEDLHRYSHTTD